MRCYLCESVGTEALEGILGGTANGLNFPGRRTRPASQPRTPVPGGCAPLADKHELHVWAKLPLLSSLVLWFLHNVTKPKKLESFDSNNGKYQRDKIGTTESFCPGWKIHWLVQPLLLEGLLIFLFGGWAGMQDATPYCWGWIISHKYVTYNTST